jgi:hypothetical protein
MMVKLQPRMYPLLPLRRLRCRMVHPLHRLQSSKIKWKQLLRGRLSPGERHRGAFKLIIHPQESSVRDMGAHGSPLTRVLEVFVKWTRPARSPADLQVGPETLSTIPTTLEKTSDDLIQTPEDLPGLWRKFLP